VKHGGIRPKTNSAKDILRNALRITVYFTVIAGSTAVQSISSRGHIYYAPFRSCPLSPFRTRHLHRGIVATKLARHVSPHGWKVGLGDFSRSGERKITKMPTPPWKIRPCAFLNLQQTRQRKHAEKHDRLLHMRLDGVNEAVIADVTRLLDPCVMALLKEQGRCKQTLYCVVRRSE
jgi:hypothetical protein